MNITLSPSAIERYENGFNSEHSDTLIIFTIFLPTSYPGGGPLGLMGLSLVSPGG